MASEKLLIDAKKLITDIQGTISEVARTAPYDPEWFTRIAQRQHEILTIIEKQPAVDAVEVLRCKNCKHWEDRNKGGRGMCWKKVTRTEEDHYCGYGEKREG